MTANKTVTANFTATGGGCAPGETEVIKETALGSMQSQVPFYGAGANAMRFQTLFLQSEINQAGYINKIYFQKQNSAAETFNNFRIYLCHSSLSNLTTTYDNNCIGGAGGLSEVMNVPSGVYLFGNAGDWLEFDVANTFDYNNTDNLIVEIRWNGDSANISVNTYIRAISGNRLLYSTNDSASDGSLVSSYAYNFKASICVGALPDTSITANPSNPTNQTAATFSFTGTNSPTSYQCQLDSGGYSVCTSPKSYTVAQGTHTFQVKAINLFGEDPTPASYTWLVDTTLPVVSAFDVQPKNLNIANPTDTITWTVTDSGGSYLDHVEVWRAPDSAGVPGTWSKIGSNYNAPANSNSWTSSTTDSPTDGIYWYGLHVVDKAGNWGTEPAPIQVTVDKTRPPKPTCTPGTGNYATSVTVTCSDTETGVTIRYTTNGTAPTTSSTQYTSALTFTSTTTLTVAAWDAATNRSDTPDNGYTYTIIVDTTPPTTTIKIFRGEEDVTAAGAWLRADDYTIKFGDKDQADGSGLNCESCTCEYSIYLCKVGGPTCGDPPCCATPVINTTSRNCNSSVQIIAGTPPYNNEGFGRYQIYSGAKDMANSPHATEYLYINFDFTPPETHIE
ncbi:MAG: hypothetical protein COS49_02565 [Candidatus Portnoybacteria bacterium CG03_land_8_20_14_0_80_41_10]|uniref:GH29D-like beta-sandwich domain-containing protein n=1 Tax=Candidatus Portnoybacteria bacterium CG03_land_8_20_14_0_80_41_10 TaxID=1974808 RepID=A0A2M7BU19_9BACT|nr:MAG: hypothetical protein COS49_02565 [Candidatus Portnoybacteria bacterium CG03_land_8_20_14_0_80_41_10]